MASGVFQDVSEGIASLFRGKAKKSNLYLKDGRVPFGQGLFFGLQHILAMFIANVAPLLIIFSTIGLMGTDNLAIMDEASKLIAQNAIQNAIFIAGIGTIIQLLFGARLPVVMGTSFAYVGLFLSFYHPASAADFGKFTSASLDAYYTILGSIFIGSIVIMILGPFVKYWKKLIKPIVPPIVVLGIGLSLMSVGANYFLGGDEVFNGSTLVDGFEWYVLVAFITLFVSILWTLCFKGVWRNINIVVSMVVGYVVAYLLTYFHVADIVKADWDSILSVNSITDIVNVPMPIDFSKLIFEPLPIIMTCIIFLVAAVEGIGDCSAICGGALGREATPREMGGTITAEAVSSLLAAVFGSFPLSTFSQNVGIVTKTKMVNRYVVFIGALFLVICGFFPPLANILLTIPYCVLGGAIIVVFGNIAVTGMKMIFGLGRSEKNDLILALSLCLGFGITTVAPLFNALNGSTDIVLNNVATVISNPVLNMFIIALLLAWILPEKMYFGKAPKSVDGTISSLDANPSPSKSLRKKRSAKTKVGGSEIDNLTNSVSSKEIHSKPKNGGTSIDLGDFGKVESSSDTKHDLTRKKK